MSTTTASSGAAEALIGRADDLSSLLTLLLDPSIRVVTLVGPPGVGKSALALHAASRLQADGAAVAVALIDAEEDARATAAGVSPVAAGASATDSVAAAAAVCGAGGLAVIDLADNVVDSSTAEGMVAALGGARLLAVCLGPLRVRGERCMPLAPLALPRPGGDPQAPAVALLLRTAQAVRPELQLTTATAPALASIARVCAGLPLALELAGRRLRSLAPQDLLLRLRTPLPVLAGGAVDMPERHRSMTAAIAGAWRHLGPQGRDLAGRIAMLAGAVTLEQVEEICVEAGEDLDVLTAAQELVDLGLLQSVGPGDEDRFSMGWPVRAYALEMQSSGAIEARLRARLLRLLVRDRAAASGPDAGQRVHVAVAAAARAAAEGDSESAGALAAEIASRLGVEVSLPLDGDPGALARLLTALGERASAAGDHALAQVLALNAAWLADAARDATARDLALRLHRVSGADHSRPAPAVEEGGAAIVVLDPADYGSEEDAMVGVRRRAGSRRVLATVLFSSLAPGEHEGRNDAEWIDLMARHDALVRRLITAHRGHAVHATGYGFLSLFDGPAAAIDCANAIVAALHGIGVGARGGLHIGECDLIDDDVTGLAVNIAARVAAHAESGEVLTTEVVRDATAGSGLDFQDRGPRQLKGVPGKWTLFAVTPRSGAGR